MTEEGTEMRIKYSLLPKLRNLSNREMDFFLSIARYQDITGKVPGVHNKDICRKTGMCKQSFYTVMRSLQHKGIITAVSTGNADYDIQIRNNDFSYEGAFREGYVNLHRQVFHSRAFQKLKANEKYLLFEFLKRTHENSSSYHVGTKNFYHIFTEMLGVTKRVVRYYLHSLRHFFSVGIKDGQYWITYKRSLFSAVEEKGVEEQEFEYFVEVNCRRHKLEYSQGSLHDTAWLLKQYRIRYRDNGEPLARLKNDLAACIQRSAEKGSKLLNAAHVHVLLKETMETAF